jgi:hypothetical protein
MKTIITTLIAFILLAPMAMAQGDGRIKVTVLDEKLAPLPGAIVKIIAGGPLTGGATGLDGSFTFTALLPGSYDIEARVTGYKRYVKTGIQVSAGQTTYAEYAMQISSDTMTPIIVTFTKSPVDPTFSTIENISADKVKHMAADRGNIVGMVTNTSSQLSEGQGGQLVMRGSREGASAVYIDGEKMYGSSATPALGIAQVSILSGGIPAEYGDLSGGAIIITTQSYYGGMAQQQRMYEAASDKEAEEKKAEDEKSGKRVENSEEIIENEQPQGEEQPAPAEEQPAPVNEQPAPAPQPAPAQDGPK